MKRIIDTANKAAQQAKAARVQSEAPKPLIGKDGLVRMGLGRGRKHKHSCLSKFVGAKIGPDWVESEAPKPLIGKGGLVKRVRVFLGGGLGLGMPLPALCVLDKQRSTDYV